jgi:DNA-binding transcriptional LysR family regulator
LLRRHRTRPKSVLEASDVASNFALIASGVGVTIASTVFCSLSFAGVVYRPLLPRTEIGSMMLAFRRDRRSVPIVWSFLEHVAGLNLFFAPPGK